MVDKINSKNPMLRKNPLHKFLFFLLLIFYSIGINSCDNSRVFEENKKIEKNNWNQDDPLVFLVNMHDTVSPHNVYLNVRNAGFYPFSNLFLFINTHFPQGQIDRDTVEITLASPDGKWVGDGLGDIYDNRILFHRNVRFPQAGEYRFEILHAMRVNPLPGIMDAGIRIVKSTMNNE